MIIIDEMSMVDLPLMNALLTAIVPGTRLILVGDCNQLPISRPGKYFEGSHRIGMFSGCHADPDFPTGTGE